jgi:ubiquitin-like domain-containing CTD phosphatase 1
MRGLFGGLLETHLSLEQDLSGYINNLPVVRVFTTDEDNDVLKPNYKICPKLKQLEDTARSSKAFKAISEEDDVLETLIEEGLLADDMKDPDIGMDCIMTTICTDRTLPSILDDYGRGPMTDDIQTKGSKFFERVVSRLEKEKIFIHQYDSARYAKLASYPLWSEILPRLLVHTKIDTQDLMSHWPDIPDTPSKFALYSTHADTIITLLASLQINVDQWPPYGSMLIIELYELDLTDEEYDKVRETYPTKTAFRMIYNGEVITPKIFACPQDDELCDIDLLVLHVYKDSDISTWGNECLVGGDDDDLDLTEKTPIDDDQQDNINRGNQTRIGAAGAVLSVMTGVIGIIIGIMISSTYLNRSSSNEETVKFDVDMNEEARIYGLERGNSGMNVETAVVA